jgi:uncharacterized protein
LRPFSVMVMEIKVADIPVEGLKVELAEEAADFEDLGEDIRVIGPVKASLSLQKVGATVYLTGSVDSTLELVCSRCGVAFEFYASAELKLDLNPMETVSREDEKELQAGDLEVEFYKDGIIDLTDFVREQLLLLTPMKPLCREQCRGLCQYCGQDKNQGECACEPPIAHPGLAGLKDLLKDKG